MEAAVEPGVLDLEAPIHHHVEAGLVGHLRRLHIPQAELGPERLGADRDGLLSDLGKIVGSAKHVDEVGNDGKVGQRRVAGLAEDLVG